MFTKPFCRPLFLLLSIFCTAVLAPPCHAEIQYTGVNLAGADFGETNLPGTYNTHYTYPRQSEVDYFLGKGMNTFRLPFRWERLQRSLNSAFDAAEFARLNSFVNYATDRGAFVVLDPHNYARYHGNAIGSGSVPNAAFADFWSRLATLYKDNDRVIFGLVNEPNSMPTEQWRDAAQAAINAIRDTGAGNLILVPGNAWTGAHSWTQNWYGTPNATAMLAITDPADNFAFDVHQYLDNDSSGSSDQVVSTTIGQQRLVQLTNWLHQNDRRAFLGEFAVTNSRIGTGSTQIGDEAIDNMLNYMEANDDVWLGWTWWAAGPWWGNYMFTLEPTNLGLPTQSDRAALAVLQPHFAVPPVLQGDHNADGAVDAADFVVWRKQNLSADAYQAWRANFGATADTGTVVAVTVPEPTTACLVAAITLGYWHVRHVLTNTHRRRYAN